jgi:hypothetical protein
MEWSYISATEVQAMADQPKYHVFGYWAKSSSDTHFRRKLIGTADTIEDARQIKDDAEKLNWPFVCIFEGAYIVEPAIWAGQKQPL